MAGRRKMELPTIQLRIRVTGRHPRFFRKQVQKPERPIAAGSMVFVKDKAGRPVGTGFYNSRSQIALRMLERGRTPCGPERVLDLLDAAIDLREKTLGLGRRSDAYRLVHAEGDGLPALIIDKLGRAIVAQLASKAMERQIEAIGERLLERYPRAQLVLSVDADARRLEGLEMVDSGGRKAIELREEGLSYRVTPGGGHKTGFFCDQRENRVRLATLVKGRRVLDLCCNSGGFAMHAVQGGAKQVEAYDLDEEAVALARANVSANRLRCDVAQADAFEILRERPRGSFDACVLDPPKWVRGADDREQGLTRYLDLNRLAFEKLPSGGLLLTCSCSGSVSEDQFLAVLREAASRAKRDARVLAISGAGPDHPVALECPETRYLKAVWIELR